MGSVVGQARLVRVCVCSVQSSDTIHLPLSKALRYFTVRCLAMYTVAPPLADFEGVVVPHTTCVTVTQQRAGDSQYGVP